MRHLLPTAAVLTATLLAPAQAPAAEPWSAAQTVSRVPGAPAIAMVNRDAVLAWSVGRTVYGARLGTDERTFRAPFAMHKGTGSVSHPTVAYDDDHNALFAFRAHIGDNHRILSATLRSSGSRTRAITLSGAGSSGYDPTFAAPAVGTNGQPPTLAWWRRDGAIGAPPSRVQVAVGMRGRLLTSSNETLPGASQASYAQLPDGTVLAAATSDGEVVVSARAPGGSFAAPAALTSGARAFWGADIATAEDGRVAVAWRSSADGLDHAFVAMRAPNGAFGAPVRLSSARERALDPRVVIPGSGAAVRVAYVARGPIGERTDLQSKLGQLRLATPGRASELVSAGAQAVREFDVAADEGGGVTLVWSRRERGRAGGALFARALSFQGRLGSPQRLTAPGEGALDADLELTGDGRALVAWQTGDRRRLRVARRPENR